MIISKNTINITVNQQALERVVKMTYLGSIISEDLTTLERKKQYFGHVMRSAKYKLIIEGKMNSKRRPGRRRDKYIT